MNRKQQVKSYHAAAAARTPVENPSDTPPPADILGRPLAGVALDDFNSYLPLAQRDVDAQITAHRKAAAVGHVINGIHPDAGTAIVYAIAATHPEIMAHRDYFPIGVRGRMRGGEYAPPHLRNPPRSNPLTDEQHALGAERAEKAAFHEHMPREEAQHWLGVRQVHASALIGDLYPGRDVVSEPEAYEDEDWYPPPREENAGPGAFEPVRRALRQNPPADDPEWAEIVEAAQKIVSWAEAGATTPAPTAVAGISPKMLKAELNRKRGRDEKTGYEVLRAPDIAAFIRFSWAADPSGKTAKFIWRRYVNLGRGDRGKQHRSTRLASADVGRDGVLEPAELARVLREAGSPAAGAPPPVPAAEAPPPVPSVETVPVGSGEIVAYGATSHPYPGGPLSGADIGYDPCDSFTVVVTGEDLNPDFVATEEFLLKIPARAVPVRPGMLAHGVIERIVPQGDSYAVVISTTQWVAMPVAMGRDLDRVFASAAAAALAVADADTATSYRFDGLEDTAAAHEWVAVFTGEQEIEPPADVEPAAGVAVGDPILYVHRWLNPSGVAPSLSWARRPGQSEPTGPTEDWWANRTDAMKLATVQAVAPYSMFVQDAGNLGRTLEISYEAIAPSGSESISSHPASDWRKANGLQRPSFAPSTYAAHWPSLTPERRVRPLVALTRELRPGKNLRFNADEDGAGEWISIGAPVAHLDGGTAGEDWYVNPIGATGRQAEFPLPWVVGSVLTGSTAGVPAGRPGRPTPASRYRTAAVLNPPEGWSIGVHLAGPAPWWETLPSPPQAFPGTLVRRLVDGEPAGDPRRVQRVGWRMGGYGYYMEPLKAGGNPDDPVRVQFDVTPVGGGVNRLVRFDDLDDLDVYIEEEYESWPQGFDVVVRLLNDAGSSVTDVAFVIDGYHTGTYWSPGEAMEREGMWSTLAYLSGGPVTMVRGGEPAGRRRPASEARPADEEFVLMLVARGHSDRYWTEIAVIEADDSGPQVLEAPEPTPAPEPPAPVAEAPPLPAPEVAPPPPAVAEEVVREEVVDVALPAEMASAYFAFPSESLKVRGRGVPVLQPPYGPSEVIERFGTWPAALAADEKGPAAMSIRAVRVVETAPVQAYEDIPATQDWGLGELLEKIPTAVFTSYYANAPAIPVLAVPVIDERWQDPEPEGVPVVYFLAKIGVPTAENRRNVEIVAGIEPGTLRQGGGGFTPAGDVLGWWATQTGREAETAAQAANTEHLSPKKWRKFGAVRPRSGRFDVRLGRADFYSVLDQPYSRSYGSYATKREARDAIRFIKAYIMEHGDIDLGNFPADIEAELTINALYRREIIAESLGDRALREYDRLGLDRPLVEPVGLLPVPEAPDDGPIEAITGGAVAEAHALSPVAADMMAHIINCTVTIAAQDPRTRAEATDIIAFKAATVNSFTAGMKYCHDAKEFGPRALVVTPEAEEEIARIFADEALLAPHVQTAQDRAFALMVPEAAEAVIAEADDGAEFRQAAAAAMPDIMAIFAEEEEPEEEEVVAVAAEPAPARAPRRTRGRAATPRAPRRPRAPRAAAPEPPAAPQGIGEAPTAAEEAEAAQGRAEMQSLFTPEMIAMMREAMKD